MPGKPPGLPLQSEISPADFCKLIAILMRKLEGTFLLSVSKHECEKASAASCIVDGTGAVHIKIDPPI